MISKAIVLMKETHLQNHTVEMTENLVGRPIADWAVETAIKIGAKQVSTVRDCAEVECILKEKSGENAQETILVMDGRYPLITAQTLCRAKEIHQKEQCAVTVLYAADTADETCEAAAYLFDQKALCAVFSHCGGAEGEPLFVCAEEIKKSGQRGKAMIIPEKEAIAVRDYVQLAKAEAVLNQRVLEALMYSGVRVVQPDTVRVDCGVTVGAGTVLYPGTVLEGSTQVGAHCSIGPNTRLTDCVIADHTEIQYSVAVEAKIGSKTTVGPFAYLRPGSVIGSGNKVGDFVEVKNATIGDGTKIAHLTYVGDADVGERVNFGCGTVVVNYDGIKKHRTVIEDDCFIGCNTNLVSPVTVRSGAYTAAGSTITDEVPKDALAIARARQVNKDGWVTKNRRKDS